jgi:hypothetical protein
MALPEFRRILKEDLNGAPDWVDGIITPVNLFFEQLYDLLNANLTVGANVNGMVYSGQFATPSSYSDGANTNFSTFSFNYTGAISPQSVLVGSIALVSSQYVTMVKPVHIDWSISTNSNSSQPVITVNYITGLSAGNKYNIILLCF